MINNILLHRRTEEGYHLLRCQA